MNKKIFFIIPLMLILIMIFIYNFFIKISPEKAIDNFVNEKAYFDVKIIKSLNINSND